MSSMNPAKRAKIEADLAGNVREIIGDLYRLFDAKILGLVVDESVSGQKVVSGTPGKTVDLASILSEADSRLIALKQCLLKQMLKLPQGELLRVDLSFLLVIFMRLLRIQSSSAKSDRAGQEEFKSLLDQLPILHRWTFDKLQSWAEVVGAASLIPLLPELEDVLGHFMSSSEPTMVLGFLSWLWSLEGGKGSLVVKKSLGKTAASFVLKNIAADSNLENVASARLASRLLQDGQGSGLSLSLTDSIFSRLIEVVYILPDHPFNDLTDTYISVLVECLGYASVCSIPSYLSPRAPLVIKLISMISVFPFTGRKTLMACDAVLGMIEVSIHPVRVLAPIETTIRLKRTEAIRLSFSAKEEIVTDSDISTATISNGSKSVKAKAFAPNLNVEALQKSLEKQELIDFEEKKISREPSVEEFPRSAPMQPQVVSAPNLLVKELNPAENEDQDNEPLPELFLD